MKRRLWRSSAAVAAVAVVLGDSNGVVQLIRTSVGATTAAFDAGARATATVLEAGGNATVAVTTTFVDAISLGGSVVDDAWH